MRRIEIFFEFGRIGPFPAELRPGEWEQIFGVGGKCHFWSFRPKRESLRLFTLPGIKKIDPRISFPKMRRKKVTNAFPRFLTPKSIFSRLGPIASEKCHFRSSRHRFWSKMPKLQTHAARPETGLAGRLARFWKGLDA